MLRLADTASDGWTATLDGKPLTRTTVDGWAQGFELPATGGTLDVTYDDPIGHTVWLWTQGLLAVVLVVLALPGRRRDVDDDMPEEPVVPAQAVAGEGRRARRLRAQAEAATEGAAGPGEFPPPQPEQPPTAVPQQQNHGQWDAAGYPGGEYAGYGDQYQATPYPADAYGGQYQADPYQGGQYDPYAYGGSPQAPSYDQAGYDHAHTQNYGTPYDPAQDQHHPHGTGSERPDGSQQ